MGKLTIPLDGRVIGKVSDGYHTFDDLYEHRKALTLCLMLSHPNMAWRSLHHHPDGDPMFDGFFIVGLTLPGGKQISYHYKLEHWDAFTGIPILDYAPKWDGHTPEDVVSRLMEYAKTFNKPITKEA